VTRELRVRANMFPAIDSVLVDGVRVLDSQTVRIAVGEVEAVTVTASDPNEAYWDAPTYRFTTETFDSVQGSPRFSFVPTLRDSTLRVVVADRFGKADTLTAFLIYPWYTVDSTRNGGYVQALDTLANRLSFVLGRDRADTIRIPLLNTGLDTLRIDSLLFSGGGWLRVGVEQEDSRVFFDSRGHDDPFEPIRLPPDSATVIVAVVDPRGLDGDGVVGDSLFVVTNDRSHRRDTIPVQVEHNDLPVLVSVAFAFEAGTPFWLAKRRRAAADGGYVFPPHARVVLHFSEPMDSASATGAISGYSILDSAARGGVSPITFTPSWSEGYRRLSLSPAYSAPNRHFGDALPPPGLFVPTDSIAIVVAGITDQARTPGGPNRLDVNRDSVPDPADADTTVALRVDSIHFTLLSVSPQDRTNQIAPDTAITLSFSSPIFPGTIDTARENNRSLVIFTRYSSLHDPSRPIAFDTVYIQDNRAVFVPAKHFFYGDSVYCRYRAVTGRDTLGYPVDTDADGLPATLLDSTSSAEDRSWHFTVTDLAHRSVSPDSGETGVPVQTAITISYPGPVFDGTIDTSRIDNRSLTVASRFSGGERIDFDSVTVDGSVVRFYPAVRFFFHDSVWCRYHGLVTRDSSRYSVDIGDAGIVSSDDDRRWWFRVEALELEAVRPDSASRGASFDTPIRLEFSGPLSPALFDTATGENNVSFSIRTRYSAGDLVPIESIRFSPDSTSVTVRAAEKFFGNDSVGCSFAGISDAVRYGASRSYLPAGGESVTGAYTWHFFTEQVGFYTYPNPFKPGSDLRHRRAGGIFFKNLHALKSGIDEVRLRVFTMDTHPVFDSREAGVRIRFREGDPERKPVWRWNACNSRGVPVASGVYFYLICDTDNEPLAEGKLMIVR
jgi:hypothetical protein